MDSGEGPGRPVRSYTTAAIKEELYHVNIKYPVFGFDRHIESPNLYTYLLHNLYKLCPSENGDPPDNEYL